MYVSMHVIAYYTSFKQCLPVTCSVHLYCLHILYIMSSSLVSSPGTDLYLSSYIRSKCLLSNEVLLGRVSL